jgi:hypothetical protein
MAGFKSSAQPQAGGTLALLGLEPQQRGTVLSRDLGDPPCQFPPRILPNGPFVNFYQQLYSAIIFGDRLKNVTHLTGDRYGGFSLVASSS